MPPSPHHSAARSPGDIAPLEVDYHETTNTYRTEFDPTIRSASEAIVNTVARANDVDSLDLPPLYAVIDPDALDALFTGWPARPAQIAGTVSFDYADCLVRVYGHGSIEVEPVAEGVQ